MMRADGKFIMHIIPPNVKHYFLVNALTAKPGNGKIYMVSCIFSLFSRNTVFIKFWEMI